MQLRDLSSTGLRISPVALGCWPLAGMTGLGVNEADSLATLHAAYDRGINFFDTAYCYGFDGLSERLIAQAFRGRREKIVIATKCGIHWKSPTVRVTDSRPEVLRREFEESLRRLKTDHVELLYLHAYDGRTPIAKIAATMAAFVEERKAKSIGVSNLTLAQLKEFRAICPLGAVQLLYNMVQRDVERDILPWCRNQGISCVAYWSLMNGLLTGRLPRDHRFQPGDDRATYGMLQGEVWHRNHDLVDDLRRIGADLGMTVAQLVVNWTIHQPGITSALCGARRPEQIEETAGGANLELPPETLARIEKVIVNRHAALA